MRASRKFGLLCVGLGVVACGSAWFVHGRHLRPTAPDVTSLMPADAQFVASVDVAAAKDTLVGTALRSFWDSGFFKRCDSFDHLASASVAFPARPLGETEFAAVLTGDFDENKILSCMKDEMGKLKKTMVDSTVGTHRVHQIEQISLSQLDAHTFIIGSGRAFTDVLDLADHKPGSRNVSSNPEMAHLVADSRHDATIWWAGTFPQSLRDQIASSSGVDSAISHVTDMRGSLGLRSGLDAHIVVGAASAPEAEQLAEMAHKLIEGMSSDRQVLRAKLVSYLSKIEARSDGKQLVLAVKLDTYEVKGLIARVKHLTGPMSARQPAVN